LTQAWSRLEALKSYHDRLAVEAEAEPVVTDDAEAKQAEVKPVTKRERIKAAEVVITVRPEENEQDQE